MKHKELADLFDKMADILEFKSENPFKISAYRKASRILRDLTQDIEEIAGRGERRWKSGWQSELIPII
jgi:DNA polymerase (family X)